jgi:hypothetical protein
MSEEEIAAAKRMVFYSSGDFEYLKKTISAIDENHLPNEENITFPQSILILKPWDVLIPELSQFIEELREKNIQRERAEREKRMQVI